MREAVHQLGDLEGPQVHRRCLGEVDEVEGELHIGSDEVVEDAVAAAGGDRSQEQQGVAGHLVEHVQEQRGLGSWGAAVLDLLEAPEGYELHVLHYHRGAQDREELKCDYAFAQPQLQAGEDSVQNVGGRKHQRSAGDVRGPVVSSCAEERGSFVKSSPGGRHRRFIHGAREFLVPVLDVVVEAGQSLRDESLVGDVPHYPGEAAEVRAIGATMVDEVGEVVHQR